MEQLKERGTKGLRWLEKYTKTDMVYLVNGGFWLGIGQFVSSGSALLASIAFANLLPPSIFGMYKYVLSIGALLTITTLSGMDSAVTQSVARGFEGTLWPAIKTKMKWGVIGSFLALAIAIYYYMQANIPLAISFSVVAFFMPFVESFDMYNSLLFGKKLFNIQTYYNAIKKIFALVAIIGVLFLTDNLYIILFVYFISIVLPNIVLLYRSMAIHQSGKSIDPDALKYGKHLSVIGVISMVLGEIDKILVFHYVGAVDLVVYALAVAPIDQVKGLLKNINSLAFPKLTEQSPEEIKKNVGHKILVLAVVTGCIAILYIILAPFFFSIFFPKYLASIRYSQILAISIVPITIASFIQTILESKKAKTELYKYSVYTNIFNVIILFPLVYYFGIWGAIISRVTTRTFTCILSSQLVKKIS